MMASRLPETLQPHDSASNHNPSSLDTDLTEREISERWQLRQKLQKEIYSVLLSPDGELHLSAETFFSECIELRNKVKTMEATLLSYILDVHSRTLMPGERPLDIVLKLLNLPPQTSFLQLREHIFLNGESQVKEKLVELDNQLVSYYRATELGKSTEWEKALQEALTDEEVQVLHRWIYLFKHSKQGKQLLSVLIEAQPDPQQPTRNHPPILEEIQKLFLQQAFQITGNARDERTFSARKQIEMAVQHEVEVTQLTKKFFAKESWIQILALGHDIFKFGLNNNEIFQFLAEHEDISAELFSRLLQKIVTFACQELQLEAGFEDLELSGNYLDILGEAVRKSSKKILEKHREDEFPSSTAAKSPLHHTIGDVGEREFGILFGGVYRQSTRIENTQFTQNPASNYEFQKAAYILNLMDRLTGANISSFLKYSKPYPSEIFATMTLGEFMRKKIMPTVPPCLPKDLLERFHLSDELTIQELEMKNGFILMLTDSEQYAQFLFSLLDQSHPKFLNSMEKVVLNTIALRKVYRTISEGINSGQQIDLKNLRLDFEKALNELLQMVVAFPFTTLKDTVITLKKPKKEHPASDDFNTPSREVTFGQLLLEQWEKFAANSKQ